MEFIKIGKKYMIKNTRLIVDEKEKLQMEKEGLILEDASSNDCQKETAKKIKKINKKIKEVEDDIIKETESVD